MTPTDPAASRCDCGAALTQCSDCAVADYQAEHPECRACVPVNPQRDAASRSGQAELIQRLKSARLAHRDGQDGSDCAGVNGGECGTCDLLQDAATALSAQCGACAEEEDPSAHEVLTALVAGLESALAALRAELAESNRLAHEFQHAAILHETAWQRSQDEIRQLREALAKAEAR